MKVGDGVHRWSDLTLELGEKTITENYVSARGGPANREIGRFYSHAEGAQSYATGHYSHAEGHMSAAMGALQTAASAMGVSAAQATEAIRNALQALNGNNTLQELADYVSNNSVTTIETREEPARSQPKDLRTELKTLSRAMDDYNITEVHSDIEFDF